ncbi:MAG: hypothetical protein IPK82_23190 [Polyangiaceae bacterium]|nr:hypothetical protein [Polyangiaceae bacterium]
MQMQDNQSGYDNVKGDDRPSLLRCFDNGDDDDVDERIDPVTANQMHLQYKRHSLLDI